MLLENRLISSIKAAAVVVEDDRMMALLIGHRDRGAVPCDADDVIQQYTVSGICMVACYNAAAGI